MPKIQTIIIAVVAVVLVVVVGLLASQAWNPSWNPFQPQENAQIVENSFANLADLKSLKYQANVSVVSLEATDQGSNFTLTLNGQADSADTNNAKSQAVVGLTMDSPAGAIDLGLEIVALNETLYIKLNSLPDVLAGFLSADLVSGLTGRWLKVEKSLLEQLGALPEPTENDQATLEEESQKLLEQIKELVVGQNIFKIEKTLASEEVQGQMADHYLVSINKEALKKIIPAYFELLKSNELTKIYAGQMPQEEIDKAMVELPKAIDDLWQKIGGIDFEIWITQDSQKLTKLKFSKELSAEQLNQDTATGKLQLDLELMLFDFDMPVTIEEPTDAQNLEEILAPFLGLTTPVIPTE